MVVIQTDEIVAVQRDERTLEEFEALIREDLLMIKGGLLLAGQHLLDARAEHPRSFVKWLEAGAAGMSRTSAYRLMEIAKSDLASFPTLENFPAESGALGELAKLSAAQLEQALNVGEITSGMHRKDAKRLVARYRPQRSLRTREVAVSDAVSPPLLAVDRHSSIDRGSSGQGTQFPFRLTFVEARVLLRCLMYVKAAASHQRVLGYDEEYAALLSLKDRLDSVLGISGHIPAEAS